MLADLLYVAEFWLLLAALLAWLFARAAVRLSQPAPTPGEILRALADDQREVLPSAPLESIWPAVRVYDRA